MKDSNKGNFKGYNEQLFLKACDLGLNEAVAFLVISCGTGKDKITSSWSANAIEKYGGISRRIAVKAIERLEESNILSRVEGKLKNKPQYKITNLDSDLVWIPNSFIMGVKNHNPGEDIESPLERLKRENKLDYIIVLFFLYKYHNLPSDGGFSRDLIHKKTQLGYLQDWGVWSFHTVAAFKQYMVNKDHPIFEEMGMSLSEFETIFSYLETKYGLIESAYYLFESGDENSEIIYPIQGDEKFENEIKNEALLYLQRQEDNLVAAYNDVIGTYDPLKDNTAASERVYEDKEALQNAIDNNWLIVPIPQNYEHAAVTIVYKMKYRPHTGPTSLWMKKIIKNNERFICLFNL